MLTLVKRAYRADPRIWAWLLGSLMTLESGCDTPSRSDPPDQATAKSVVKTVAINNFKYEPATLVVSAGTTVQWTNSDDMPHTVTSKGESRVMDSKALDSDDTYTCTFTKVGTYDYICTLHPSMSGRVVVK